MTDQGQFDAITNFLQSAVETGEIPGAVFWLSRKGEVLYHNAFGWQDDKQRFPMTVDSLFRLKSMTKLVTTIAILTAIEDASLSLMDPLKKFIPEFGDLKVISDPESGGDLVKAHSDITIYHLLTHTSGLCYGQGGKAIQSLYNDAGLYFDIFFRSPLSTTEVVERLATLPLLFQPGTNWAYSWGSDILGRVLEIIDNKQLEHVFYERVFRPLGIKNIGFSLGEKDQNRMAQPRSEDRCNYFGGDGTVDNTPFYSGGEGLVSSAADWGQVVESVLGFNRSNSLISPTSVRFMLSDHAGSFSSGQFFNLQEAYSYGMGTYLKVRNGLSTNPAHIGEFGWWGSWGTHFWGDAKAGLAGVFLMQKADPARYYCETIKYQVYQALKC